MSDSRKKLGLWMCTALVVGNMIGSGVFLLPSSLAPYGTIGLLGWLVTTSGALLMAFIFARLATVVTHTGGPYAFARRGFGDFIGFQVAWGYWISISAGNAAIAVAFVGYLAYFFPELGGGFKGAMTAMAAIWLVILINLRGIRQVGMVQLITAILKLLPLVAIALFGLFYVKGQNLVPFNPSGDGFGAITATAALTLWAFMGLESATIPSGDVENPERTIPRATIIGTLIAASVYILGSVTVMGVVPNGQLVNSTAPFADAARIMWGDFAGSFVAVGAIISSFGALNGWILLQGQIPMAAATDKLFPGIFARRNQQGMPYFGLISSSVIVTLIMSMSYTEHLVKQFDFVILLSTLNTLVPYAFSAMTLLLLMARGEVPARHRGSLGTVVVVGLGFLYVLWAIGGSGRDAVYWGFLLLMAGIPVYVWNQYRQSKGSIDRDS